MQRLYFNTYYGATITSANLAGGDVQVLLEPSQIPSGRIYFDRRAQLVGWPAANHKNQSILRFCSTAPGAAQVMHDSAPVPAGFAAMALSQNLMFTVAADGSLLATDFTSGAVTVLQRPGSALAGATSMAADHDAQQLFVGTTAGAVLTVAMTAGAQIDTVAQASSPVANVWVTESVSQCL
jgi:hypothetical protein